MSGQTFNTSPTIMSLNTPNNNHRSEWACVRWFNNISDTIASKTCPFLGYTVATVVSVITFIPSLAVDAGYAAKRLYSRNITKPHTQISTSQNPGLIRHTSSVSPEIPRAVFIIGGCGSGKSTLADQIIKLNKNKNKRNYVLIDADKVKEEMPEYKSLLKKGDPNAAVKVHSESLVIKDKLVEDSRKRRSSIVYCGTGSDSKYYNDVMNKFKNDGYYVKVYLVNVDESACISRAQQRQKQTGRKVPLDVIKRTNQISRLNFNNQFKQVAHTSRCYENSNSMKLLTKSKGNWSGLRTIQ